MFMNKSSIVESPRDEPGSFYGRSMSIGPAVLHTHTSPKMMTTQRQIAHEQDIRRVHNLESQKKTTYKINLQQQKISNLIQKELQRLYVSDRELTTTKASV
jgi:hypothetical protein